MSNSRGRATSFLAATAAALAVPLAMLMGAPAAAASDTPPADKPTFTRTLATGDTGDYVAALQSRLRWMGYDIARTEIRDKAFGATTRKAVREFQEKFFIRESGTATPRTRDKLLKVSGRIDQLPKQCRSGRVICIDVYQKLLRDVNDGKVRMVLDARFGMESTPTRHGMFTVYWKSRDHWSSAFDVPMPYSLFFSGGQAIHFSKFFRADGYYGASRGCVNIRDRDAAERLFDRTPVGTPVFIYSSKK